MRIVSYLATSNPFSYGPMESFRQVAKGMKMKMMLALKHLN